MYIIFISRGSTGGSNLLVRMRCSPCNNHDEFVAVYGLYLFDLVQTVIVTDSTWVTLCAGWGNPTTLVHTTWSFSMIPVVSGLSKSGPYFSDVLDLLISFFFCDGVSSWVQIFFAYRVRILGGNRFWNGVTIVIVAVRPRVCSDQWRPALADRSTSLDRINSGNSSLGNWNQGKFVMSVPC